MATIMIGMIIMRIAFEAVAHHEGLGLGFMPGLFNKVGELAAISLLCALFLEVSKATIQLELV